MKPYCYRLTAVSRVKSGVASNTACPGCAIALFVSLPNMLPQLPSCASISLLWFQGSTKATSHA